MAKRVERHEMLSVAEYLEREEHATERHEYVAGETYAMTGGTLRHGRIIMNIAATLRAALTEPCDVFSSDVKVRAASDVLYYPDVVVACGALDPGAVYVTEPCLVVEVTSPSSRRIDRREKLAAYLAMPSVHAYLIVEQDTRRVEHHCRRADGSWQRTDVEEDGTIELVCPGMTLTLADVYARVTFAPGEQRLRVREDDAGYECPSGEPP